MLRSVFTKTLYDARRNWPAWALGVIATVAFVGAVYPSFRHSSQIDDLLKNYPDALKSLFGIAPGTEFGTEQRHDRSRDHPCTRHAPRVEMRRIEVQGHRISLTARTLAAKVPSGLSPRPDRRARHRLL